MPGKPPLAPGGLGLPLLRLADVELDCLELDDELVRDVLLFAEAEMLEKEEDEDEDEPLAELGGRSPACSCA